MKYDKGVYLVEGALLRFMFRLETRLNAPEKMDADTRRDWANAIDAQLGSFVIEEYKPERTREARCPNCNHTNQDDEHCGGPWHHQEDDNA